LARLQNKAAKRNRLLDFQLVILLLKGHDNKQMAKNLVNPVGATQRRTRLIFIEDLLFQRYNRIMQGPEDIRIIWKKEKISDRKTRSLQTILSRE
jgi:hypothetical protein